VTVFIIVCHYNNSCRALSTGALVCVDRHIILILFADCWTRENYMLDVFVVNSRWIKGSLQHHTILQKWKWFMVVTDSLHSSIAAYDLYERTARCKFIGQVDFSSRLGMTCTLTNGARKFQRWRYYRPTRPNLEGPSRWVDLLDPTRRSTREFNLSRSRDVIGHVTFW